MVSWALWWNSQLKREWETHTASSWFGYLPGMRRIYIHLHDPNTVDSDSGVRLSVLSLAKGKKCLVLILMWNFTVCSISKCFLGKSRTPNKPKESVNHRMVSSYNGAGDQFAQPFFLPFLATPPWVETSTLWCLKTHMAQLNRFTALHVYNVVPKLQMCHC